MDHHHHHHHHHQPHYVPMPFHHRNHSTADNPKKKPKPKLKLSPPLQDQTNTDVARPCTECGKKFSSWKALFGHMRCHPERQWRGINPPPNLLRPTPNINPDNNNDSEDDDEVASCLLMLANGPPLAPPPDLDCHSPTVHHVPQLGLGLNLGLGTTPHYCSHISPHVDSAGRFECSGCKKVFASHQALGGHRASHKNVKGCFAITKKSSSEVEDDDPAGGGDHHCTSYGDHNCNHINSNNNVINVHKCSICLRVFSSGQALGGHMRCHWEKKVDYEQDHSLITPPNHRAFDLNLPAPVHDDIEQHDKDDHSIHAYGDSLDLRLGV